MGPSAVSVVSTVSVIRPGSLGHMGKVQRTEAQWREMLTPDEYQVLREAGTEAPWAGEYTNTNGAGADRRRARGAELFRSGDKLAPHCASPSLYQAFRGDAVALVA